MKKNKNIGEKTKRKLDYLKSHKSQNFDQFDTEKRFHTISKTIT